MRALAHRQEAAPLGLAGTGIGEPLVPALGPDRQQPRVPVADVAAVIGGHQILVPGQLGRRARTT